VHQGHRLAVRQPHPLQRHHQRAFRQAQRLGDLLARVGDLGAQHGGGRTPAGRGEVVVQARQLDVAIDALAGDESSRTALPHHKALVGEVEERGAHGGAGQPERLRELNLVVQAGSRLQRARLDGRLVVLRHLKVQRHGTRPVDRDRADRAWVAL